MALPNTSSSILHALQNLSQETNKHAREALLKLGFKEMLKWFTLAAKKITDGKIKLPKQTASYMLKHKDDVKKLSDPMINDDEKRKIILKPGGGVFLGGVIIRSLIRWNGVKTARTFSKQPRQSKKKNTPKRKTSTPKRKTSTPKRKKNTPKRKKNTPKRKQTIKVDETFITQRRRSAPKTPIKSPMNSKKQAMVHRLHNIGSKYIRYMTPRKLHFQDIPSTSLSPRSQDEYNVGKRELNQLRQDAKQYVKSKEKPKSPEYTAVRLSPRSVQANFARFSPLNNPNLSEPARIALTALQSQFL